MDTEPTIVVFRVWRDHGDVLALFPCVRAGCGWKRHDANCCTSYVHVGQHGAADYCHCIRRTHPATPGEYADLKAEFEEIGYVLTVRKRAPAWRAR